REELDLVSADVDDIASLFAKKLVGMARLTELRREHAKLEGENGQLEAEIARVRSRISETQLEVLQLDRDFQAEILDDLRETDAALAESRERAIAAEDQLQRIDIRSPQAGTVHALAVHAAGAVIEPGEAIMSIVPQSDRLVVDLHIDPRDIDRIRTGSQVAIRLLAANQRTTPTFDATVRRVSADLTQEANTGRAYYVVRVVLDMPPDNRVALHLRPGMPVEGYVRTGQRTPLEYLVEPLSDQIARVFRER